MNNPTNQDTGATQATAKDRLRLRRSTRSTRIARPIDPPFWESIGYDAPTAMNMANFTHFVNWRRTNNKHRDFEVPYPHEGDMFVPFHDQLLPHWRVFAKSLEEKEGEGDNVSISGVHMPKAVFDMITPALSNVPNLCQLELDQSKLDYDGFFAVAEILRHQEALKFLSLPKNEIVCEESAGVLSAAMRDHPSLEKIQLLNCALGKNEKVLEIMLEGCGTIMHVDVRYNYLASRGVGAVARFISKNHTKVMYLDLEGNAFSDEDTPQLVAALKMNTNFRVMDITQNNLSQKGREDMVKAVFDSTSLNDVVTSNHSCHLRVGSTRHIPGMPILLFFALNDTVPFEEEMQTLNGMGECKEAKIQYKVLSALQNTIINREGEVNLQYLNNVPMKCMPRVLGLVQKHMSIAEPMFNIGEPYLCTSRPRDSGDLSRLFHVLKGWEMPVLFSFRDSDCVSSSKKGQRKRKRNAKIS